MDYDFFDLDNIRVEVRSFSIFHIIHMIEEKRIELFPDFQRKLIWDDIQKSRLIESLILNIPLPIFYLSENRNGVWEVVDGMQRLNAIFEYTRNQFGLKGTYLSSFNGLKMEDLPLKYQQRILNFSLTFHIIDSRTPEGARFEIFRRINTQGTTLTAQEIRNSFLNSKARHFINKLSTNNLFNKQAPSVKDDRMGRQELVLKFLAFYEAYDFDKKRLYLQGSLTEFLNEFTERLNHMDESNFQHYSLLFVKAMENAQVLFGKYAFHRLIIENNREIKRGKFSKSLFVIQSVILANYELNHQKYAGKTKLISNKILDMIMKDENIFRSMIPTSLNRKETEFQLLITSQLTEELINYVEKYYN